MWYEGGYIGGLCDALLLGPMPSASHPNAIVDGLADEFNGRPLNAAGNDACEAVGKPVAP